MHLLVDYWAIVHSSRPNRRGAIKLRAQAQVAGRRRPRRSSLRLRWVIRDDTNTAIGGASRIPAQDVIARSRDDLSPHMLLTSIDRLAIWTQLSRLSPAP